MKINIKTLKKVLNNLKYDSETSNNLIQLCIHEENNIKKEKYLKQKEERSYITIDSSFIFDNKNDDMSNEELIREIIIEEYSDTIRDDFRSDDLPDEGDDIIYYWKINDKVYETNIHCSSEWVSDYSARYNAPDELSITSITEINYEFVRKERDDIIIKKI